jgi:hypothetical protein
MNYQKKYLKYKSKYLITKNNKTLEMHGGSEITSILNMFSTKKEEKVCATNKTKAEFDKLDENLKKNFFFIDFDFDKLNLLARGYKIDTYIEITKDCINNFSFEWKINQHMYDSLNDDVKECFIKIDDVWVKKITLDNITLLPKGHRICQTHFLTLDAGLQAKFIKDGYQYIKRYTAEEIDNTVLAKINKDEFDSLEEPLRDKFLLIGGYYIKKLTETEAIGLKGLTFITKEQYDALPPPKSWPFNSDVKDLFAKILYGNDRDKYFKIPNSQEKEPIHEDYYSSLSEKDKKLYKKKIYESWYYKIK